MLYLGSTSARRREILSFFNLPFEVIPSHFDESTISQTLPVEEYVATLALKKAEAIGPIDGTLITADTIVALDTKIFGKPASYDEAKAMLSALSGKSHRVLSAVCVHNGTEHFLDTGETKVHFHSLTDKQIEGYIRHFHVLDKAGAYAIQEGGGIIADKIEGCYYNVMGLPLEITVRLLNKAGIDVWDELGKA